MIRPAGLGPVEPARRGEGATVGMRRGSGGMATFTPSGSSMAPPEWISVVIRAKLGVGAKSRATLLIRMWSGAPVRGQGRDDCRPETSCAAGDYRDRSGQFAAGLESIRVASLQVGCAEGAEEFECGSRSCWVTAAVLNKATNGSRVWCPSAPGRHPVPDARRVRSPRTQPFPRLMRPRGRRRPSRSPSCPAISG